MPSKKFFVVCIAVLVLTSSTAGSERPQPYTYVTGEKFLSWPSSARTDYVTGIVDALSYLTETTGIQRGLSDCFRESDPTVWGPITWELITKDAVVEAAKKGDAGTVSVPEQLFAQIKLVCRDEYQKQ